MIISDIKDFKTNKILIKLDDSIAFVLYKGDLSKYGFKIGCEVYEDTINDIFENVLYKRALDRSLKLITGRDMTEGQIMSKLKDDYYPIEVIQRVIEKLKSERLLDDERFIRCFIESKSNKKSKRDILASLYQKGIDIKIAESVYDKMKEDDLLYDEEKLIRDLLVKRHFDFENASYEERAKQSAYLYSKGFSSDSIHSVIKV